MRYFGIGKVVLEMEYKSIVCSLLPVHFLQEVADRHS
jgi:hypothetical protein